MSDPPRQVNVGRGDGDFAIGLVNAYDPLKGETRSARSVWRTRSTISCLCVAKKPAAQDNFARWILVVDAVAGRAKLLLKPFRLFFGPVPAPTGIYRAALRA